MQEKKVVENIIATINKNVRNKKWECMYKDCSETAINSHILQKNGILNQIAPDGIIYEIKPKDVFSWENLDFKELTYFKAININSAHSFPTFCNKHDTNLFKVIESHPIDFSNYNNTVLFAFRTLLSFMRREEIILEKQNRLYNSNTIKSNLNTKNGLRITKEVIDLHNLLAVLRNKEYELFIHDLENNEQNFTCIEFNYPLKEIYSSTIINSPYSNFIYINIFPYNNELKILMSYYTESEDEWTKDFISSWDNLDNTIFELKLTTFLLTKCENWGLSKKEYDKIDLETKNKIIEISQNFSKKALFTFDNTRLLDFSMFQ